MRSTAALAIAWLCGTGAFAADSKPRTDAEGFPLPAEAVRRLGSAKFLAGDVSWAAFSPDNKTLLTFENSSYVANLRVPRRGLMAWDIATGKTLWERPFDMYWAKFAVAPEGKTVWLVGSIGTPKQNGGTEWVLWQYGLDLISGKIATERKLTTERCDTFDVAADGSVFRIEIRAGFTPEVYGTDKLGAKTFYCDTEHLGTVRLLKRSRDGKRLYAGFTGLINPVERETPYIAAFDVAKGVALWKQRCANLVGLECSADSKSAYALDFVAKNRAPYDASVLRELDADTGKESRKVSLTAIPGHYLTSSNLRHPALAMHPDGQRLLVYALHGNTVPVDLKTFAAGKAEKHDGAMGWFSPDGKLFAGVQGGQVIACVTKTTEPIPAAPAPFPSGFLMSARGLSWNGAGTRIAKFVGKECVEWDIATAKELFRGERLLSQSDSYLGWVYEGYPWGEGAIGSGDGQYSARYVSLGDKEIPSAGEWRFIDSREPGKKIQFEDIGSLESYKFTPDGRTFAGRSSNKTSLKFWDIAAGGKPKVFEFDNESGSGKVRLGGWEFSPDSRLLVVVVANAAMSAGRPQPPPRFRAVICDTRTYAVTSTIDCGAPQIHTLVWSRDGRRLAGLGKPGPFDNAGAAVFVAEPGAEAMPMPVTTLDHPAGVIALSPDGRTLAVSTLNDIRLYEVATRKLRHTFNGLKAAPSALEFSPDGRYLASDSADGPVLLWDVRGELAKPEKPASLDPLWPKLRDGTAIEAFAAIRLLAAFPDSAIPFLKAGFADEPKPDAAAIAKWIGDLGGKDFAARDKADRELRKLGSVGKIAVQEALLGEVNQEFQSRAEAILDNAFEPDRIRAIRAVEILTWVGTAGAKELLGVWAAGDKKSPLTQEAKRAIK